MAAQVKFTTDEYPGGYATGLSMLDSWTMARFHEDCLQDGTASSAVSCTDDGVTDPVADCTSDGAEGSASTCTGSSKIASKTVLRTDDGIVLTETCEDVDVRGLTNSAFYHSSHPGSSATGAAADSYLSSTDTIGISSSSAPGTGFTSSSCATAVSSRVTRHLTSIYNGSDHPVTLEMITSFCLPGIKADRLYRMSSFWSAEGRLRVDRLADLNLERSWAGHGTRVEKFGTVGSMPVRGFFPFVALEDSETGRFTAATLYTPSSWQIEIMMRRTPEVTLAGGLADADFGQWTKTLQPGETFTAPRALTAEGSSLLEVCDLLLKAQTPDISPADYHMGISFNEYCTTWGDPTIDNMKKICDKLANKSIQYLVMDSGWYLEKGQSWWDHIGKWEVNKTRFPNGLRELSDYVRSKGMIPGIWFEPESVAWGCELYNKPEYLLCKNGVPITVGGKRFFDMENKTVRDYLRDRVIRLLKENNFGYIKIDYNDTIGVGCEAYEPATPRTMEGYDTSGGSADAVNDSHSVGGSVDAVNDSHSVGGSVDAGSDRDASADSRMVQVSLGEGLRRKLLATQDFFRELKRELPDLVIENCSSGGHRLEPSMMELSSMASFSDAHEPLCVPLIAANLLRLVRSEQNQIWAVLRKDDTDARIYYSLCSTFMGRIGMSGDIYDLSDHQWELVDRGLSFYREAADIIRYGSTTAIETNVMSYNDPVGYQYTVKEYGDKLLVIVHRFRDSATASTTERTYLNSIPALAALLSHHRIISTYGDLSSQLSAHAWICDNGDRSV